MAGDPNTRAKNTTAASNIGTDANRDAFGLTNGKDWRSFFGAKPDGGWGLHGKEPDAISTGKNAMAPAAAPVAALDPAGAAKMAGPDLRTPNAISDFPVGPDGSIGQSTGQPMEPSAATDMASLLTGQDWSGGAFDAGAVREQTINNANASLSRMGSKPSTASMFQSIGGNLGWDEPV